MRLLGDGPIIDTTKNGENVPRLEIVRNVLVFCSLVEKFIYKTVNYCS